MEKGWHVAYIGISDMYGCPEAVAIMEKFYRYMTEKVGLSRRVDLFGFSRGALYAVNFTVGRPEAVSTLYLDAPVLNVRSWPGGFGDAARFEKEWEECKQVYHISEEDASAFKGNPLDKLDQLLAGQVKIMLVAGGADTVVPYKENGKLLASYYEEHGGTIKVIVKPDCDHRKFTAFTSSTSSHWAKQPSAVRVRCSVSTLLPFIYHIHFRKGVHEK